MTTVPLADRTNFRDEEPDYEMWASNNGYHKVTELELMFLDAAHLFANACRAVEEKRRAKETQIVEERQRGRATRIMMGLARQLGEDTPRNGIGS